VSWPGRRCGPRAGGSWPGGEPAGVFESGVMSRTVVIEFHRVAAVAAYEIDPYQEALRVLGDGVERDLRIIEALPA
jgi:uncharacterized protein (DUF1330 family)